MGLYKSAKKVISAFSNVGFVNGLTDKQYEALNELLEFVQSVEKKKEPPKVKRQIAKSLRKDGLTIREICAAMGYKHPGSVSHLLK
jgi:hypothetical protein